MFDMRQRMEQPPEVVNFMVNNLPEDPFVSNTATFFDPAMGKGDYLVAVVARLRKYHPYATKEQLLARIYGVEANDLYIRNCLFRTPLNGANIYKRSYDEILTLDLKQEQDMPDNFDCVISNPPYQNATAATGRKTATKPFWFYFVERAFDHWAKDGGIVAFVTPTSWMQTTTSVNKYLTTNKTTYVNLDTTQYFRSVSTTNCCWITYNTPDVHNQTCVQADGEVFDFNLNRKFLPSEKSDFKLRVSILDKTIESSVLKFNVRASQEHHTGYRKHLLNPHETDVYKYPVFHTNSQTLWASQKSTLNDTHKVVISKTGSLNGAHVNFKSSISQIAVALVTSTEKEAEIALTVLQSKLYRFIIESVRFNSTIPSELWRSLPAVDLARSWTDKELYTQFNLTDKEIELIENKGA